MGILNLSPDSFSDGGAFNSLEKIINQCWEHINKGAHIIDFGAVATNPATTSDDEISIEEEFNLLFPALTQARAVLPKHILFSVDTFSPTVAYKLAELNLLDIINDIKASQQEEIVQDTLITTAHVAAKFNLGLILMHMPNPKNALSLQCDVLSVIQFLKERLEFCSKLGVKHLSIDPGIGYGRFGKTWEQIMDLLSPESIVKLSQLGAPLLIGVSRKSFQQKLDPTLIHPKSRDILSKQIEHKCIQYGAHIIRTHNLTGII